MAYTGPRGPGTPAHIIAVDPYGFCTIPETVFEAGVCEESPLEWIRFANKIDQGCVYIKYEPGLYFATPYRIEGELDPDSTGNYKAESGHYGRPTYFGPERKFFIWWDGRDSWLINEQIGHLDGPYWKRTDPAILGNYDPFADAAGIATVILL